VGSAMAARIGGAGALAAAQDAPPRRYVFGFAARFSTEVSIVPNVDS
jgi:hypothetical protein